MKTKIFLIFFFIFLTLAILIWRVVFLPKEPNSKKEVIFEIKKGEGMKEIAQNLKNQGLIKSATLFRIYTFFKGISGKLQAGEYLLSSSMALPEIARKFVLGEIMKEKVTIVEGWSLEDIGRYFEEKEICQTEELLEIIKKDFSGDFDFLKDKPSNLDSEGYLFPDTYEIKKGESTEEIVRKMLKNFDKKLKPELREEIDRQGKTIFEIITTASMIEKEVKTFEDKKLVSGILWKRLENGIPLQVDATIAYITGENTTRISIDDTKIDSPYNTYKYKGLPVGPISNPGLDSILAAIYPEESNYWYYLSTPEGKTIFSKTLEEHNIAKAKYLK